MDEEEEEEKPKKRFKECRCISCGYITKARKGISCYNRRCPECGSVLVED